jgi:hypothetical protein
MAWHAWLYCSLVVSRSAAAAMEAQGVIMLRNLMKAAHLRGGCVFRAIVEAYISHLFPNWDALRSIPVGACSGYSSRERLIAGSSTWSERAREASVFGFEDLINSLGRTLLREFWEMVSNTYFIRSIPDNRVQERR